jgi:excinuclease UvrABC nuclease subunit
MVTKRKITIVLRWSRRIRWVGENATAVPQKAGVYTLITKHADGKYYRDYVGQSENLVHRFLEHLSPSEPNGCVRRKLHDEVAYFRYALVASKDERLDAEQALYDSYGPTCNEQRPPGSGRGCDVELDEQY